MAATRAEALSEWREKKLGFDRKAKEGDKYFFYELRKRALSRNLSPEQYEEEANKIAKELGI